mmetsp:Transcript_17139/g.46414  ORF Transcript_17139/g.46414 Transcript_17139/m.46414 type:complete len:501 (+) Transcript_17139:57-1559(+)
MQLGLRLLAVLLAAPTLVGAFHAQAPRMAARVRAGAPAARMMVALPDAGVEVDREDGEAQAKVKITIPGEATRGTFDTLVKKAKTQVAVDGFTKGKAPDALVIGAVGKDRLASDAIATLIEHYAQTAIGGMPELNAIGEPQVLEDSDELISSFSAGEPLTVTLSVELWPEFEVEKGAYDNLEVEVEVPPFNQKAYDETLKALRARQSKLEDMADGHVAVEGDTVLVDMTGYEANEDGSKGTQLDVASGQQLTIELQPGRFMPGLVEGLLGATKGEKRLVPVEFSSRSQQQQLAGKKLLFDVQVQAVQQRVLPDLDDDFADSIEKGLTLEGLNEKVREGVQAEVDKMVKERVFTLLEQQLVEKLVPTIAVPDTLITEHARKRFATMLTELRDKGEVSDEDLKSMVTPENFDQYKEDTLAETEMIVRASLLVDTIAQLEGIAVERSEMEEQKMMMKSADPEGMEKVDDAMLMTQIEATLLREKVLDLVMERATVTKVQMEEV